MNLTVGQQYNKKDDFGITGIVQQWSEVTVEGELFTFFSIFERFDNKKEEDGFVYEGRAPYTLIPDNKKADIHRHVFIKEERGSYWTYLGKGKYEVRYDEKHNKIFW